MGDDVIKMATKMIGNNIDDTYNDDDFNNAANYDGNNKKSKMLKRSIYAIQDCCTVISLT